MRFALLTFGVIACGSSASRPPDAGPCTTDDQCVLSDVRGPDDCCGQMCWSNLAYHVDDLAHLERERDRRCKSFDHAECPMAECRTAPPRRAGCRKGACELVEGEYVEMPYETRCMLDTDCRLAPNLIGGECTPSCEEHWAYDDDAYERLRADLRQRDCSVLTVDCGRAPWKQRALCKRGACVVERMPWE